MKSAVNPFPNDRPLSRRTALSAFAGLGAVAFLAACGSDSKSSSSSSPASPTSTDATTSPSAASTDSTTAATTGSTTSSTTGSTNAAAGAATDPIPEETGGPFPGDGSNGPDILSQEGVVRNDIRTSVGSASGTAEGVPLTLNFVVTDSSTGGPLEGSAVYAWHCDRDGAYSMYSGSASGENYLRGVQVADSSGNVSFTSVYPAAYSGRWPHVHLEIYATVDDATGGGQPLRTTQLAFPEETCAEVYATDGYEASVRNLSQTSLSSDNVFSDDEGVHELATMTGSVASGLVATLALPI